MPACFALASTATSGKTEKKLMAKRKATTNAGDGGREAPIFYQFQMFLFLVKKIRERMR